MREWARPAFVLFLLIVVGIGLSHQGGASATEPTGELTLTKIVTKDAYYGWCKVQGIVNNTGKTELAPVILDFRWMDGDTFKGVNEVATDQLDIPVGGSTTFDVTERCANLGKTFDLTAHDASGPIAVMAAVEEPKRDNARHHRHRYSGHVLR